MLMAGQMIGKMQNLSEAFSKLYIKQQNRIVEKRHKSEVSLLPEARMHSSFLYSTDILQCPYNKFSHFFLHSYKQVIVVWSYGVWCLTYNSYLINVCKNRNRDGTANLKKLYLHEPSCFVIIFWRRWGLCRQMD